MRFLSLLAAAALLAHAAPARAAADVKIGYVDLQRALNEIDEGKAAKAKLKAEFEQKQKVLDDKRTEFTKLRTDYEKQASVLAEPARRERQEDLDKRLMDLQSTYNQLQAELSDREREATRGIFDKMGVIIRESAEAEGFTMVVEKTDAGILYAPASLDLTNELVRKYNARHRPGTASAGAAAPAPKAAPDKAAAKKPTGK